MKKIFTIPNLITIFRILLIPIFMVFYLNESFYSEGFPLSAILIFLLAFFSDVLDGLLARNLNKESNLGKVLDPLADKLVRLSIICAFWIKGVLPLYVFIMLLVIDLIAISMGILLFCNKLVFKANIFGKISTIFMSIALFSCFLHNIIAPYDLVLVLVAILLVLVTLVQYFIKYFKIIKRIK